MDGSAMFEGANANDTHDLDLQEIVRALSLIYDPRSANEDRRLATAHLDDAKTKPTAPSFGFKLACDSSQDPAARHYGLSCLEYHVKYRWDNLSEEQSAAIRGWAVELARDVSDSDPQFLRNKIAHLWTTIAERSWGLSWQDFDQNICELWQGSLTQKGVVLHILETLSEEVFSKEDSTAGLRGAELGKLCVEIFTPSSVLDEIFGQRKSSHGVRAGHEGWFLRLLEMLRQQLYSATETQEQTRVTILKILSVLRSAMSWIIFKAVSDSDCLELLCRCLMIDDLSVHMASVEVMHAMFHRQNTQEDQIEKSAFPLMTTDGVALLRKFYETSCVNVNDIDETKYTTLKKFSEVMCALGMYLIHHGDMLQDVDCDLKSFIELLVDILKNPSLVVSVPVLYLWTRLLSADHISKSPALLEHVGTLLGVCSHRLVRYELLPSDSEDTSFLFLNEDFETMPDRHAFLGNYRRFCTSVIERIVVIGPYEALSYLLSQSDNWVQDAQNGEVNFSEQHFASDSFASLSIEAQCTVISTALKSYMRCLNAGNVISPNSQEEWNSMQQRLEKRCVALLQAKFHDPIIQKRLLIFVVEIACAALPPESNVGMEICRRVLTYPVQSNLTSTPYDEALKDLQSVRPRELQKLAMSFPDSLLSVYDDLDAAVTSIVKSVGVEPRIALDYRAFLFSIVLRASNIDEGTRSSRFEGMMQPVVASWQSPIVERATSNFPSFCHALGLEHFPRTFLSYKAHEIEDWSSRGLDDQGKELRENTRDAVDRLPLLATRSLLSISTDRLPQGSHIAAFAKSQWQELIPMMLPKLLQLISNAHAFNNPDSWSDCPPEMRNIITRIVQDRVWQNGISSESRDDFYAKIRDSKMTIEGLASAVRGSVRTVRELCMFVLHYLCNLGDTLYKHDDLPEPLSRALYADANHLSAHQLNSLLRLSQALIEGCPAARRGQFLPPMLTLLFKQLDAKTSAEWDAIERRSTENANTDELDSEMKTESVLRNLTHFAVLMVSNLLGLQQKGQQQYRDTEEPSIRTVILTSSTILEPVILFCTHALRMHDSRCCVIITRVLRSLIPEFQAREGQNNGVAESRPETRVDPATAAQVREFISSDVLKSCITSIHEPYFSEASLQKDLASLIASIIVLYSPVTSTPRDVLLSMPSLDARKVDGHIDQILRTSSERQQRAWVLSLLEGVKGVSIYELGKVERSAKKRAPPSQERFMAVDELSGPPGERAPGNRSPDLGGIVDLFG